jgi:hypothetical protein
VRPFASLDSQGNSLQGAINVNQYLTTYSKKRWNIDRGLVRPPCNSSTFASENPIIRWHLTFKTTCRLVSPPTASGYRSASRPLTWIFCQWEVISLQSACFSCYVLECTCCILEPCKISKIWSPVLPHLPKMSSLSSINSGFLVSDSAHGVIICKVCECAIVSREIPSYLSSSYHAD